MSKRKRFVVTSVLLSLGFFVIQFIDIQTYKFIGMGVLCLLTLVLFIWSLREGLGKNLTLLTLILPVSFTASVGLFWFLLPASWLLRIPVILFFAAGTYALSLTSNIFTVSAIRTIALLRAAKGVGFLLTLVVMFLIYDTIFSLRTGMLITSSLVFLSSLILFLQGFWTVILTNYFSNKLVMISIITSLVVSESVISIYFWPVTVVVGSLFLTVTSYMLLGLGQAYLEERLFVQTVREYLIVGVAVFLGMFLVTRWGS